MVPREVRPGPRSYAAWATNISAGAASEAGQHLTATVALLPLQPGDPKALEFDVPPSIDLATGDLRFTIKHHIYPHDVHPDDRSFDLWYSSAGLARVRVTVQDDGGTAGGGQDSTSADFTIFLDPVPAAREVNIKHPWKSNCVPITLAAFDADTDPELPPDFVTLVSPYPWPKVEILTQPTRGFLADYVAGGSGGASGDSEEAAYYANGMSPTTPEKHDYEGFSYNYNYTVCWIPFSSTWTGSESFTYRVIDPDGNASAPALMHLSVFGN